MELQELGNFPSFAEKYRVEERLLKKLPWCAFLAFVFVAPPLHATDGRGVNPIPNSATLTTKIGGQCNAKIFDGGLAPRPFRQTEDCARTDTRTGKVSLPANLDPLAARLYVDDAIAVRTRNDALHILFEEQIRDLSQKEAFAKKLSYVFSGGSDLANGDQDARQVLVHSAAMLSIFSEPLTRFWRNQFLGIKNRDGFCGDMSMDARTGLCSPTVTGQPIPTMDSEKLKALLKTSFAASPYLLGAIDPLMDQISASVAKKKNSAVPPSLAEVFSPEALTRILSVGARSAAKTIKDVREGAESSRQALEKKVAAQPKLKDKYGRDYVDPEATHLDPKVLGALVKFAASRSMATERQSAILAQTKTTLSGMALDSKTLLAILDAGSCIINAEYDKDLENADTKAKLTALATAVVLAPVPFLGWTGVAIGGAISAVNIVEAFSGEDAQNCSRLEKEAFAATASLPGEIHDQHLVRAWAKAQVANLEACLAESAVKKAFAVAGIAPMALGAGAALTRSAALMALEAGDSANAVYLAKAAQLASTTSRLAGYAAVGGITTIQVGQALKACQNPGSKECLDASFYAALGVSQVAVAEVAAASVRRSPLAQWNAALPRSKRMSKDGRNFLMAKPPQNDGDDLSTKPKGSLQDLLSNPATHYPHQNDFSFSPPLEKAIRAFVADQTDVTRKNLLDVVNAYLSTKGVTAHVDGEGKYAHVVIEPSQKGQKASGLATSARSFAEDEAAKLIVYPDSLFDANNDLEVAPLGQNRVVRWKDLGQAGNPATNDDMVALLNALKAKAKAEDGSKYQFKWAAPQIPKVLEKDPSSVELIELACKHFAIDAVMSDGKVFEGLESVEIRPNGAANAERQASARRAMEKIASLLETPDAEIAGWVREEVLTSVKRPGGRSNIAAAQKAAQDNLAHFALRIASARLELAGVAHRIIHYGEGDFVIQILPESGSRLGSWVKTWTERFPELKVKFSPGSTVDGQLGGFDIAEVGGTHISMNIGAEAIARVAPTDEVTSHEAHHAHVYLATKTGKKIPAAGRFVSDAEDGALLGFESQDSAYSAEFSLDELDAYQRSLILQTAQAAGKARGNSAKDVQKRLHETQDALRTAIKVSRSSQMNLQVISAILENLAARSNSDTLRNMGGVPWIREKLVLRFKKESVLVDEYKLDFRNDGKRLWADIHVQLKPPASGFGFEVPLNENRPANSPQNFKDLQSRVQYLTQVARDRSVVFGRADDWFIAMKSLDPKLHKTAIEVLLKLTGKRPDPDSPLYRALNVQEFNRAWEAVKAGKTVAEALQAAQTN